MHLLAKWIPDYANRTDIDWRAKNISFIDPKTFDGLTQITQLNFNSNQLTNITTGTFDSLINLSNLDLSYNLLTPIDTRLFANLNQLKAFIIKKCEFDIYRFLLKKVFL